MKGAFQLAVLRLLITRPVKRHGVLTGIACPAEENSAFSKEAPVALLIVAGIAVDALSARAAVMKSKILPIDELSAVGFEAVYAHFEKIRSLGKPGVSCLGIGEVRDHGAGKPMSLRNGVGAAIGVMNAEPAPDGIFPIQIVLTVRHFFLALLLVDGHLPEQQVQPGLMELVDHALGIRPRLPEAEIRQG